MYIFITKHILDILMFNLFCRLPKYMQLLTSKDHGTADTVV